MQIRCVAYRGTQFFTQSETIKPTLPDCQMLYVSPVEACIGLQC